MAPTRKLRYYRLLWLRYDLPAGLYVFFVALPLCLSIAIVSGAPPAAGILTGVIGGIVVSLISGSQLSVSGPAAGLSTVVAASIAASGDYRVFLLSVIVAGVFQFLLGMFRLATIANYFPSAVIKGMLAAIGIILISKQVPIALGYTQPDFWSSGFLSLFSLRNFTGNVENLYWHSSRVVITISLLCLGMLIFFQQPMAKRFKVIPAPLMVVVAAALMNYGWTELHHDFHGVPLVHLPKNILGQIAFPDFSKFFTEGRIFQDGIVIGLLASLETLLCVEAIDKLDKQNRVTPVNREMIAQGIGNILCGMVGAIPMTAVIVRGAANVDAGARTKLSSFTHGLLMLAAGIAVPFLINYIPNAALAAILLITGYNLTKPKLYRNMFDLGWKQFLPFAVTILVILLTDLLLGVSIGLIFSIYFIIQNNFREDYALQRSVVDGRELYVLRLNANVTFLNKVKIRQMLNKIPPDSEILIDGRESDFVDFDVLEILSEFENRAHEKNIKVKMENIERVNISAIH